MNINLKIRNAAFLLIAIILLSIIMNGICINANAAEQAFDENIKTSSTVAASTENKYLYLTFNGKDGNVLSITVWGPNPKSDFDLPGGRFYYNSKMCFSSDAAEWTGLSDVEVVLKNTIPGMIGCDIEITTNWFADAIAVSYIADDGYRYISYGNMFDLNYLDFDRYYSKVAI